MEFWIWLQPSAETCCKKKCCWQFSGTVLTLLLCSGNPWMSSCQEQRTPGSHSPLASPLPGPLWLLLQGLCYMRGLDICLYLTPVGGTQKRTMLWLPSQIYLDSAPDQCWQVLVCNVKQHLTTHWKKSLQLVKIINLVVSLEVKSHRSACALWNLLIKDK